MWNNHADTYDDWYTTFEGAVENYVDWQLLKKHLPKGKNARILDAAGGTGRLTLPLAKMGFRLVLCDVSPRMLFVAKQKMLREGVLGKVDILECDIRNLDLADEIFDFVLCWDGAIEAMKELIRVTKKGGGISIFLVNRLRGAIDMFPKDPTSALALIKSRSDHVHHHWEKHRALTEKEGRQLVEAEGIRVIDVYAVCGWMKMLGIPDEALHSRDWDKKFFEQTTEMVLELSKEPPAKGLSKHLVLYGEKT